MTQKIYYIFLVVGLLGFISPSVQAQDIHFSQFYLSPLNLNPALTGVMNCNKRLAINYRNQWASAIQANAYNTYSASYDTRISVGQNDYFGIGGSFWGDVAGELSFGTMQARLSGSFSKYLGGGQRRSHYLVFGVDGAISQRRVNTTDARWPSQHDGLGGFDASAEAPTLTNTDFLYPDVAAGLVWFTILNEDSNFYIGASMHHLNQANISFLDEQVSLYTRLTVHAGGQIGMNERMSLIPGAIFMFQGPHREYNAGLNVRMKMGPARTSNQYFQIGGWFRAGTQESGGLHSDAAILSTRFETGNFGIGFSYDWTLSEFRRAGTANGAFEFSLTYLVCGNSSRGGVYCPTF